MSAGPKVSVALPVRNGMPHLADAVEALRRQTFRDFELVVQDGLSTDGSVDYLGRAGLPFPLRIVSERDGSLVTGYNRAVRRCTGELVVAAACDEVLDDDALERYVSWYDEHPRALYIYGGSRILEPSGTLREFQPKDFRLIDYIRHQMCPTTAGAFNRRLLGREFYFDESLKTVPDFEFFTRIALRFGEDRILCKRAITMTARGDEASMSFRPSAFARFARDKEIVIDRLTKGRLKRSLLDHLRRDALFHMHAQFAEQIHGLAGDGSAFREQVLAAQAAMPGHPEARRLAAMSRHFRWDEEAKTAILRRNVAPLPPPREGPGVASRIAYEAVQAEAHWAADGATARRDGIGVQVRTPAGAWHYAAWAPIGPLEVRSDALWHWLRVVVSDVTGQPRVSLFEPQRDLIHDERLLEEEGAIREIFFELVEPRTTHLLFRNGDSPGSSSVLIREIEVLTMPIVPSLAA